MERRCPKCNGFIQRIGNGEKPFMCPSCKEHFSEKEVVHQTNADRIRSMTDEELARILAEGCHGTIECPNCCGEYTGTIKSCTECWLDWLKEEVKEE